MFENMKQAIWGEDHARTEDEENIHSINRKVEK